MLPYYHWLFGA